MILPLGDFSLIRDIPNMYRNYVKITSDEELGIVDFIGDYLLHGKEIFGHNENDKPQSDSNAVQFQHQANSLNILLSHSIVTTFAISSFNEEPTLLMLVFQTSDYYNDFFRPPLA